MQATNPRPYFQHSEGFARAGSRLKLSVTPRSRRRLNAPTVTERVSADEFARRHGLPESAVVHRIRAGIYDGVYEDETWYVLPNASPASVRTPAGFGYTPPPPRGLPWATVPFPIRWTRTALRIGLAILVVSIVSGQIEEWGPLFGIGVILVTGAPLYEGLRTGTIRAHHVGPVDYRERPGTFVLNAVVFVLYPALGAFFIVYTAFAP